MGTVWDPIADGSEIVGILNSSKRNNRRPARNSYTSPQRSTPSSGGGSFFAHVKSALSWTLGLGIGAALLVGLGVGGLQLHRLATTSEFFAIKRVEIRGTTHFSREEVLKAANLQSGVNSLTVNIADVEQGLRDNPWVLSVAVKRRLPDAFEIRIRERIPAFWMLKDGVLYYADNRGQIIAPVNVGNFLSLPTLEILPGGEELLPQMDELSRLGIDYDVIPGVSSFLATAAALKKEYTLPGVSQTVILTRMEGRTPMPPKEKLRDLAKHNSTMIIFLSVGMIEQLADTLKEEYREDTPVAVVYKASWEDQKIVIGNLTNIAQKVKEAGITKTALTVVGDFLGDEYELSKLYDKTFTHEFRQAKE